MCTTDPNPPLVGRPPRPQLPAYPSRDLRGQGYPVSITISKPVLDALDALVRSGHGSRSDLIERCVEHFVGRQEASVA